MVTIEAYSNTGKKYLIQMPGNCPTTAYQRLNETLKRWGDSDEVLEGFAQSTPNQGI